MNLFLIFAAAAFAQGPNKQLYTETLPKLLCQDDQYFVACFEGASKKCVTDIKALAAECLKKNEAKFIQNRKKVSAERAELSENIKMGSCVGQEYDKKNSSNKKDIPKCYSQKSW